MLLKISRLAVLGAVAALGSMASAQLFDFEGETNDGVAAAAKSSLTMVNGGITVTITRSGGGMFGIGDISGFFGAPAAFGSRTLDPFSNPNGADYFIATFSHVVSAVSIQTMDFGADIDNPWMQAYSGVNGTGSLLGSDSLAYGTSSTVGSMAVGGGGIRSIRFGQLTTDSFNSSMYWDNLQLRGVATGVPGPAAALAFGLGLIRRRRRSR